LYEHNLEYIRTRIKRKKKIPKYICFGLKKNEINEPDQTFEIAFLPPSQWPIGNYARRISLHQNHEAFIKEVDATWFEFCVMALETCKRFEKNNDLQEEKKQ
jgi:hypothetical protein